MLKYNLKDIVLLIGLILVSFITYSQQKTYQLDTLIIQINDQIEVKIASYDNTWLPQYEGFFTRIEKFQHDLEKIQKEIPKDQEMLITSNKPGDLMITNLGSIKRYKISESIIAYQQNQAFIIEPKYKIIISFQEIQVLINTEMQACVNKSVQNNERHNIDSHGYIPYSAKAEKKHTGVAFNTYYSCQNDSVIFNPDSSHYNPLKSMLELNPQLGVGVIKNTLVTDFNFRIGIYETDMGILRNHYYVAYNLVYDFNPDQTFNLNHFINLGYRKNYSSKPGEYRWIGAEIGYLFNSNGTLFTSPTFKFGTLLNVGKNLQLTPEIYFEDNFNKAYPGLRLSINFINWK